MSNNLRRLFARVVFYPTLAWNLLLSRLLRIRRWWDHVDPHVIVGAYPFSTDVPSLHDAGVRAVVNTCEEYLGPLEQYEKFGIVQFHMPTTDFTHPKLKDIEDAVEFVQRHVENGETVYIHCKAGRARSATVALCWLMMHRNLSADEAQEHLLQSRPHINPHLKERPVVRVFADSIAG